MGRLRSISRYVATILTLAVITPLVLGIAVGHAQTNNNILNGLWEGLGLTLDGSTSPKIPSATSAQSPYVTPPDLARGTYAAMGDSVAAGLGLPIPAGTTAQATQCGRSTSAYPYEIAHAVRLNFITVACSGATIGDLFTEQGSLTGMDMPAQIDAVYATTSPNLITITAGANDAHWTEFLRACYVTNCDTDVQTALANGYLVLLQSKLLIALHDISSRGGNTPPTVIITGYYNPLSAQCLAQQSNITADELIWLNAEVAALNQTIKQTAAVFSFAKFAPVSFAGHDICSTDPWVQGLNDSAPFHPTATGQHEIARSVLRTIGLGQ